MKRVWLFASVGALLPATLASAAVVVSFVTLWWPWLVVTGETQIPFMSDTNATYDVFAISPQTGLFDVVKFTGDFPHARYMSVMVYGGSRSQPFDVIADYQIQPDPGSVNPFTPGQDRTAPNRRFTLYAVREGSQADVSGYDNVLTIPASESFINIMMRTYRSDDGRDIYGGVPLPTVELGRAEGAVKVPGYGLFADLWSLLKMFVVLRYKEAEIYPQIHDDHHIEFYRLTREGGLPNRHVPYLDTALGGTEDGPGAKLAVLTFRPPSFEDTHTGTGTLSGTTDVRYYSFCTSDVATGFNSRCISDSEIKKNRDGTVTLVVYPPVLADRVVRSGLNRLVRGYSATVSLTYRQMLPAPGYLGNPTAVPPLPLPLPADLDLTQYQASSHIGAYAPTGFYLTGPEFDHWFRRYRGPAAP